MSDSIITEIEDVLEGAVPFAGTIADAASAANKAITLVSTPITQAEVDHPTNEQKERIQQYETIINNPNEGARSRQLFDYCGKLFNDARIPVDLLSGGTVTIPIQHLTAFITGVGQLVEEREQATAQAGKSTK